MAITRKEILAKHLDVDPGDIAESRYEANAFESRYGFEPPEEIS